MDAERRIRLNRIRRNRQLRRRISAFTVLFILSLAIGGFGVSAHAQNHTEEVKVSYKYYASVMVEYGDTLETLSQKYVDYHYESTDAYVHEVMKINHLADADSIYAGEYLIMPYYSTEAK